MDCEYTKPTFNNRKPRYSEAIAVGIAEFLATTTFIFVTCTGAIDGLLDDHLHHFQKSAVAGFAVMIAIHNFGHISGAHINPITTLCAFVLKVTPLVMVPVYVLTQLAGAATGYGILKALTPSEHFPMSSNTTHGICTTVASPALSITAIVGFEIVLSAILTFANCTAFDPLVSSKSETLPLKFGFLVAILITAAGPISGAVMNPARSFGPAIWNNDWQNHWIYWIAPVTAASIVSVFYRLLYLHPKD